MREKLSTTYDPTKLDDLEMLQLIALGLILYLNRVRAGEENPFPYPEALLRGFNQLCLACALRDVARIERPTSIPEFVAQWGPLPFLDWPLKLEVPSHILTDSDRLLDPDLNGRPTKLCYELGRGKFNGKT